MINLNWLDKKTKELISELKLFSEKEIYEHIREKLKMVPVDTQESISKFLDNFSFWGSFHPTENDFSTLERLSKFLKENSEKFEKMYQSLEDYRSKKIFYAILNNWYNYDFINLEQVMEKCFSHYFDLDIIPSCQEEVFVDLGAFNGDTVEDFIKIYGDNYKKIYAYEMTEQSMRELKERVKNYPRIIYEQKAVSDELGMGSIKIHEISTSSNQLELEEIGEIEKANSMLGSNFILEGVVKRGAQIGRTIGFPTANIDYPANIVKIPFGVYKAEIDGKSGVLNWGMKPTVHNTITPVVEVHVLDFNDDLYGKNIKIEVVKRIRGEQKFSGLEELKAQIKKDIEVCSK